MGTIEEKAKALTPKNVQKEGVMKLL